MRAVPAPFALPGRSASNPFFLLLPTCFLCWVRTELTWLLFMLFSRFWLCMETLRLWLDSKFFLNVAAVSWLFYSSVFNFAFSVFS